MTASSLATPLTKGSQPIKAISRMRAGLRGEMLAAAEADLEPERSARVREGRERIARIDAQPRQKRADQLVLRRPQPLALAAAVERARGVAPGRGRPVRQDSAERSVSTRSVRSHEKPPSASGLRPKWP